MKIRNISTWRVPLVGSKNFSLWNKYQVTRASSIFQVWAMNLSILRHHYKTQEYLIQDVMAFGKHIGEKITNSSTRNTLMDLAAAGYMKKTERWVKKNGWNYSKKSVWWKPSDRCRRDILKPLRNDPKAAWRSFAETYIPAHPIYSKTVRGGKRTPNSSLSH